MNRDGRKENLIPLMDRTEEERKEIASKGGRKKAEKQKERKLITETFNNLLDLNYDDDCYVSFDRFDEKQLSVNLKGHTLRTRLCAKVISKALAGDMRAMETIFRYAEPNVDK